MPSSSQSVIDKRGYIFALPTLGLPDLAGEWVNVKVAIASKDKGIIALNAGAYDAPRRFACPRESVLDVEYEGAVWILPLCSPEKAANETEVFTLRVRRHLASTPPDPKRIKLPDGLGMWYVEHQESLASFKSSPQTKTKKRPNEEEEKVFWRSKFAGLLIGFGPHTLDPKIFNARWMKLSTSAHLCGWHTGKGKEQPPDDSLVSPGEAFNESWRSEAQAQALKEAVEAGKAPLDAEPPNFNLQARMNSREEVIVEYACLFGDATAKPRKEDWKRVPTRAWRPGYELKFFNQVRERYYGKKPLTEDQLLLARPTSES